MDIIALAIQNINKRLYALRTALAKAVEGGYKSASVSNGGASQSYTTMDIKDMRITIADLERAKQSLLNHGRRRCISPNFVPNH